MKNFVTGLLLKQMVLQSFQNNRIPDKQLQLVFLRDYPFLISEKQIACVHIHLIIQANDSYRCQGRGKWKGALKEMRKGDDAMVCKGREIQYCIHKCSTYFGECLWRIMSYALAFNKKFWDLACLLSWRTNLFNHPQKSAMDKTRNQVAWFILHLKQQLEFWFEQIF